MATLRRTCEQCGREFEAQKVTARFCSASHRVAWNRAQKKAGAGATVLPMRRRAGASATLEPPADDSLSIERHIRAELGTAGVGSALGQMCLVAARRIDRGEIVGSALASVLKRLDELLPKAIAAVEDAAFEGESAAEEDPITFLRERAEARARSAG